MSERYYEYGDFINSHECVAYVQPCGQIQHNPCGCGPSPWPPFSPCQQCRHCPPMPPNPCRCCEGPAGANGKSAYEIALDHGFIGTEYEWLESLKGQPGPFLSSYIEAVATTQTVGSNADVVFIVDEEYLDKAGNAIELNAEGTAFTITQAGLYHVEWSVNLTAGNSPVVMGLLENGQPTSALANIAISGNYSSGALINVSEDDLPVTVSLHNFSAPVTVSDANGLQNIAASMRILRFADGASS